MEAVTEPRRARRLVRGIGALATAATLVAGLAACAPPDRSPASSDGAAGTVTLGAIGGSTDSIQPYAEQSSTINEARINQLYDGLTYLDHKGVVRMGLAESMTSNADHTIWTVHLRPGVTLHNGKDFTAKDVVESVHRMLDPQKAYSGATPIAFVDPDGVTAVDEHTVRFTLKKPYGPFASAWTSTRVRMADWSTGKPIGTGPFTLDSFTPGQESTFTRYADYWGEKPDFHTLKIVDFRDQQAVTNALRGGQIDIAYSVPFTDADSLKRAPGVDLLQSKNSAYRLSLDMRTDEAPFDDPRVRRAMMLIANRKQIVENAFGGYATVGNDITGTHSGCPAPDVPQRTQDIAKAKKLLAEAGESHLTVDLVTDGALSGMKEMAQLYAQQAKEAGVTVNVRVIDTAKLLDKWGSWPFVIAFFQSPYVNIVSTALVPDGENNAAHFDDHEFNALADRLFSTADQKKHCSVLDSMQKIEHDRGGYIVPALATVLTAHRDRVQGLRPDVFGRASYLLGGVSVKD